MADEKTTEQPQERVSEQDLSSAWESAQDGKVETKEEPKQEEKEEPTGEEQEHQEHKDDLPEEPVDNADRSRLGRNVSELKKQIGDLTELVTRLTNPKQPEQQPQISVPNQQQTAHAGYDQQYIDNYVKSQVVSAVQRGELPETIVTAEDNFVVNSFADKAKARAQYEVDMQFAQNYVGTLNKLKGDTPDDVHAEVIAELYRDESPFNKKRAYNPQIDAQLNYLEAKAHILQKKQSAKPTSVFKGKPEGSPPTGTQVSTRTAAQVEDIPELDDGCQDLIRRMNISPDSVKSALKSELPYYLKGFRG